MKKYCPKSAKKVTRRKKLYCIYFISRYFIFFNFLLFYIPNCYCKKWKYAQGSCMNTTNKFIYIYNVPMIKCAMLTFYVCIYLTNTHLVYKENLSYSWTRYYVNILQSLHQQKRLSHTYVFSSIRVVSSATIIILLSWML